MQIYEQHVNSIIQAPNPDGWFHIQCLLYKGEKRAIYQAQQLQGDQVVNTVLLKLQLEVQSDEKEFLENLKSQQNKNPNSSSLIRVHEVFPYNNHIVIIMEAAAQNLKDFLKNCNNQSEKANICKQVIICSYKISAQIQQLHDFGYVHGTLTPESFIKVGSDWKLFNFEGIRKLQNIHQLTPTPESVNYTAPELLQDAANITEKVDVWSLGCIFYEMIERNKLFGGDDFEQVKQNILNSNSLKDGKENQVTQVIDRINITEVWKNTLKQMVKFDFTKRLQIQEIVKKLTQASIIKFIPQQFLKSTPQFGDYQSARSLRITGIPQLVQPIFTGNVRHTQWIPTTQNQHQIQNNIQQAQSTQFKPFVPFLPMVKENSAFSTIQIVNNQFNSQEVKNQEQQNTFPKNQQPLLEIKQESVLKEIKQNPQMVIEQGQTLSVQEPIKEVKNEAQVIDKVQVVQENFYDLEDEDIFYTCKPFTEKQFGQQGHPQ